MTDVTLAVEDLNSMTMPRLITTKATTTISILTDEFAVKNDWLKAQILRLKFDQDFKTKL